MSNFSMTIAPRFYETDALGHINNAAIAAWFEVARINFLESLLAEEPGVATASQWVLASLHIDFVAETFYGSDVTATVTQARIGNTSLTVTCEMSQKGQVTVRGVAVLVFLDGPGGRPAPVPVALRQHLASEGTSD